MMMFKIVSRKKWEELKRESGHLLHALEVKEIELCNWKKARESVIDSLDQALKRVSEVEAQNKRLNKEVAEMSKRIEKISQLNRHYEADIQRLTNHKV